MKSGKTAGELALESHTSPLGSSWLQRIDAVVSKESKTKRTSYKLSSASFFANLYHGTNKNFGSFDLSFVGVRDWGDYGVGVYLSTSPELAISYARDAAEKGGGDPVVHVVRANLSNVANFNELMEGIRSVGAPENKDTSYVRENGMQSRPEVDSREITKYMTSLGFDAAKVGKEICVYDPSLLSIVRVVSIKDAQWLP